jgi:peptidoglycan/LPS O-acetylase OafA/YrhL
MTNRDAAALMGPPDSAPGTPGQWLHQHYWFVPRIAQAAQDGLWGAFRSTFRYNGVLWTMPVELYGSFLVFAVLALAGRLRNRVLLYVPLGAVLVSASEMHYLAFVLGLVLCDVWVWAERARRLALPLVPGLALLALGLFLVSWAVGAAVLVVAAAAFAPTLRQGLAGRGLSFLGRISFGLYLLHTPILCSLGTGAYLWAVRTANWGHTPAGLLAAAVTTGATLGAAALFARFVDEPAISLARWVDERLFRPGPGAVALDTHRPAESVPRPARAA